ncbi:hypothetical protein PIROE2DRAFT_9933 [Piromyces sp. E2]|nr:hypothetical protein PIROE2DRAFT_9933 [Piromyces sp. E2]|eukprot:OUM63514.1 hypothetical protein PIROE2DRAFT_9933 [Piromyces sp. E2]
MVAILHSNSPKSIPCTPKKSSLFQKNHTNLKTDTPINNLDIASSSTSNKCLTSSPSNSSKIYYKKNISNSLIQSLPSSLPPIDNISNYHNYYHNPRFNTISKRHVNSSIEETSISKDNMLVYPYDTMVSESLNSPSISSSHEKPIDIQSFKDTIDSTIAITPPSTTPSTPTTPSSTSSKDIDPFDESLTSIKNSLESKNLLLLKSKETPISKTNTPLTFSTSSQYTRNESNCKTMFSANNTPTINHPKINRSPSNKINGNIRPKIIIKTPISLLNSTKEIRNNNFDSRITSKDILVSSIPSCPKKLNKSYSSRFNILSNNNSNSHLISPQFKSLCHQLLVDLQHHSDSGPFLTALEDKKDEGEKDRRRKGNKNKKATVIRKTKLVSKITDTSKNIAFDSLKPSLDLCSIQHQLEENSYKNVYSVFLDIQQMLLHCYKIYSSDDHFIHRMGKNIEKFLIEKLENMPKEFINELREQCLQHYQQYRRLALSPSTSYPVLPTFLKVIALPTLLDDDFETEEDWMITEENLFDESVKREEQIKECKKKEKEKLCLILNKNNSTKIIKKSKGKSVAGRSNDEQILASSSPSSNVNKKPLVLSFSKKRKHNQKEDETTRTVRWNVILKKIPHSSGHHVGCSNHINKKIKTLEYESSKTSWKGRTFVRHPKNKNWVIQLKRNGQYRSIVFSRNSSYHNYRRSNFSSSKPFNFILIIPTEIVKNSPWSNLFYHYTNSTKTVKVEDEGKKLLFNTHSHPKSITLSTKINNDTKTELPDKQTNAEKDNKMELSPVIKEPEVDNSVMEITKISDGQEKRELDDVILIERCPSTSSEFNKEDLLEKEEMKCSMICNFLPPTPPSSSPPSSPMNISEEEVEEMEEKRNDETMIVDAKEIQNTKEEIINAPKEKVDIMEDIVVKDRETAKENNEVIMEDIKEKDKEVAKENEEVTMEDIKEKDKEMAKENDEVTMVDIDEKDKETTKEGEGTMKESPEKKKKENMEKICPDFNPLEWLENKKDSNKSLSQESLKKNQQELLTNYLLDQQIIETQMLIDHLNSVNNPSTLPSLSTLYPLNNFDDSLNILPSFSSTNNANPYSSLMMNIDTNVLSTSLNSPNYDATNDFIDWDKACGDNITNTSNLLFPSVLSSSIDTTLPLMSDSTNASLLLGATSTENITNPSLNLYDESLLSSILDLPSTSTNPNINLSLLDTNNIACNSFTSDDINSFVNGSAMALSSSELASGTMDLTSSPLNVTSSSLNQNLLAINSIPYSTKLLANSSSLPLMDVKDPLLLNGLNDPAAMTLHSLPSNLHYSSSVYPIRSSRLNGSTSTPPSASSNGIYKHHRHINSSNLYTTASNIATSLTAASKKLSLKSNKIKASSPTVQPKPSPSKQQKIQKIPSNVMSSDTIVVDPQTTTTSLPTTTTSTSVGITTTTPLSKPATIPEKKITLDPATLLNLSSIEDKDEDDKEVILDEKVSPTSTSEKTITEPTLNSLDRITPTIPSKIIADAMPSLSTPNSDVMLSESSEVCQEVQDHLSLLSGTTSIIENENGMNATNDLAMTTTEDFLTPPNYSYYDLLLNLNNNCNETLISEMAIHETSENMKLPENSNNNNIKQEITEKEVNISGEKIRDESMMKTPEGSTISYNPSNNTLEKQSIAVKREDLMDEDVKKNRPEEEMKIEEVKPKPKRIRISLDLSHSHNKKEDEDDDEEEEDESEEDESFMEQDLIEEEEEEEENMEEDVEFEDEETDDYESDEKEDESDEYEEESEEENEKSEEEEEEDIEEEDDDDEEEEEEEVEEEEDDDEESSLSLMDMKRIKQQQQQQPQLQKQKQNQKETSQVVTTVKNIKINPPIPRIIVHTKRSMKTQSENHEYIDVQQLELEDILENVFDIESLTPEVLSKLRKSIPAKPKETKKIMSLAASGIHTNNTNSKKDRIINLSKLVLKENKERKIEKKPVVVVRPKKMRGRNAVKVPVLTETNPNKMSNINTTNTTTPTRGKGRPKGHCGRPRKRWPEPSPVPLDNVKSVLYNANKENKENKFMVEESGNTLFIRPELQEKSPETIITQVSVTTSVSVEPIIVITSTVPSSVITSTRNSHFYSSSPKQCTYCGSTSTPLWRHGPPESPRLCNSCGVKWKRGKILQSQPSGFPWNSISVDKKTEEFRSLMRCITSDKVLKVLGILKTCMTIAMKRQLDRGEEVKIDIRNIDSRAWSQLYRYIKCQ